jgi:hypothetical protein
MFFDTTDTTTFARGARSLAAVAMPMMLACLACGPGSTVARCEEGALDVVEVSSRDDIDALPRVETIRELRVIESDLEDLSGFECLKKAENIFIERNPRLRSLEGLEALTEFALFDGPALHGAEFSISENPELRTLAGVDALERLDGSLRIRQNEALVELDGFDALRLVDFQLEIAGNPGLETITGLTAYVGAEPEGEAGRGALLVQDNPRLTAVTLANDVSIVALNVRNNLALQGLAFRIAFNPLWYEIADNPALVGLPDVLSVGPPPVLNLPCDYSIVNNDALTSLEGLSRLDDVGLLIVQDNDQLVDLRGLESLREAHELTIENNAALTDLAAIDPAREGVLATVLDLLAVRDNVSLPSCEADALAAEMLANNADLMVEVSGNGDGGTCP